MKIYTKTGDKGKTSLFDGTRVYKNTIRVEAYGTIDELNSVLGVIVSQIANIKKLKNSRKFKKTLIEVQNNLFEIGSTLANPQAKDNTTLTKNLAAHTKKIEGYIDELTVQLPQLQHFILPGGGSVGAFLHLGRTVSRRAERMVVSLLQQEEIPTEIIMYINRLSDLFYTMSRYVNYQEGEKEIIWTSKRK